MKSIIIKSYPAPKCKAEVVRLQKDAQKKIHELQRESGLSASFIVSEIIRKAAPYVEIREVVCEVGEMNGE